MVRGVEVAAQQKAQRADVCGILPLDKPAGPTSHDVVDSVRKLLSLRRVGHTGTLDPFASGVLVLCIGRATRLAQFIADADKEYVAQVTFGEETDTLDPTGEVLAQKDCTSLTLEAVQRAAASFAGEFDQVPPQFSAVKIGGERAYAKARRGEDPAPAPRGVKVSSIDVTSFAPGSAPKATLRLACSKGFYVRALARDLGEAVSCPAMLTSLRRTRVGAFALERCLSLADLPEGAEGHRRLLPMATAVEGLRNVELSDAECARLCSGEKIEKRTPAAGGWVALTAAGDLVAIGAADGEWIRPKIVLRTGV